MGVPELPWVDEVEVTHLPEGKPARLQGDAAHEVASLLRRMPSAATGAAAAASWGLRFFSDGIVVAEAAVEAGTVRGEIGAADFALGLDGGDALARRFVETLEQAAATVARELAAHEARRWAAEVELAERTRVSAAAREGLTWERTAGCPNCQRDTRQLLHGFDQDGLLWKGHICACRGWQCAGCSQVLDRRGECCK